MKKKHEIREWLINNAQNKKREIDLSYIDFEEYVVLFNGIVAKGIHNHHQTATYIYNFFQNSHYIHNDFQNAQYIFNNHQNGVIDIINKFQKPSSHENVDYKKQMTKEEIEDELGYKIEIIEE